MKILVSKNDIEAGKARDSQNCPVALALRRAGVSHFGVSGIIVWIASPNRAVVLPVGVQDWILNYDYGLEVGPMEFELTLPEAELKPVAEKSALRYGQRVSVPAPPRLGHRRSLRTSSASLSCNRPRGTLVPETELADVGV